MTPDCMVCRGACCETILLPATLQLDEEWAEARGIRRFTVTRDFGGLDCIEVPCACPKLSPMGACSIYDRRPTLCADFTVGGVACLSAIGRRRTPEKQREILGDEYFGNVIEPPGRRELQHASDCQMGVDCTCTYDVPPEPA